MTESLVRVQAAAEQWNAQELLAWAAREFGDKAALASSLGAEDVVLIDMVSRIGASFAIFTLDTDFLFPETYELISSIEERYGISIERVHPQLNPEFQAREFGEELWKRQPDRC